MSQIRTSKSKRSVDTNRRPSDPRRAKTLHLPVVWWVKRSLESRISFNPHPPETHRGSSASVPTSSFSTGNRRGPRGEQRAGRLSHHLGPRRRVDFPPRSDDACETRSESWSGPPSDLDDLPM